MTDTDCGAGEEELELAVRNAVFSQFNLRSTGWRGTKKYELITGPSTICSAVMCAIRPYITAAPVAAKEE